jgi:hypothetical protein
LGERAFAHGGLGIEELCDWLIARTGCCTTNRMRTARQSG